MMPVCNRWTRGALLAAFAVLLAAPGRLVAQDPTATTPDSPPPPDSIIPEEPLPRNAFIRALVLPGWGHYYIGEPKRGLVFTALQGTSIGMLVKTLGDLGTARDRRDAVTGLARDSVNAAMAQDTALARQLEDPDRYDAALLTYPGLRRARQLVSAREEHRQDWIAYTLFFTFAGAVDAYVTAHLKDFPADLSVTPARDGSMRLGFRMPFGTSRSTAAIPTNAPPVPPTRD